MIVFSSKNTRKKTFHFAVVRKKDGLRSSRCKAAEFYPAPPPYHHEVSICMVSFPLQAFEFHQPQVFFQQAQPSEKKILISHAQKSNESSSPGK